MQFVSQCGIRSALPSLPLSCFLSCLHLHCVWCHRRIRDDAAITPTLKDLVTLYSRRKAHSKVTTLKIIIIIIIRRRRRRRRQQPWRQWSYSQQQYMRVISVPHPYRYLVFSFSLAILVGRKLRHNVVNRKMVPQNVHILVTRTCEHIILYGKREFTDVTLRWEYCGLSG